MATALAVFAALLLGLRAGIAIGQRAERRQQERRRDDALRRAS